MTNLDSMLQLVAEAKAESKIIYFKNVFQDTPKWDTFYELFKKSFSEGLTRIPSPGTLGVDNSERYTDVFDDIISTLSYIHPGNKIAVLSIVHFMNANDNKIPVEAQSFFEHFIDVNPHKLPPGFDYNLFQPLRHFDPVDGFYIQCEGNTTWRAFYKDRTDEFLVSRGDMLYVPKGIEHSVESMNVRSAISVSFFDKD